MSEEPAETAAAVTAVAETLAAETSLAETDTASQPVSETPAAPPVPAPVPVPTPGPRPSPPLHPHPHPAPPAAPAPTQATTDAAAGPAAGAEDSDPVETPAPAAAPHSESEVAAAADRARAFGRVAEDGTVLVRVGATERPVGSYPGATPAEALAYFARKYDALAAEVALLEQRAGKPEVPARDVSTSVERLRAAVATASAVGDLEELSSRLDVLATAAQGRQAEADAAKARARETARAEKERIVAESEELAASSAWKATGDRFRVLLEEWKKAPRLDRKSDDELWKRFSTARSAFDKVRRQHFAGLDAERAEAKARKEALVAEAESLSGSSEWGTTAGAYRELMTRWKAAGRAGRDDEEALWVRFRAAQDAFFSARNAVLDERDSGQVVNLSQKEALAAEAEALLPVTDHRAARRVLRSIGERWEAVGHVPRGDRDQVEGRLRRVEEAVRDAEQDEWRRTNPEGRARAEAAVSMLQQAISALETKAEKARANGRDKDLADAEAGLEARRSWLAEAERALAEFTR